MTSRKKLAAIHRLAKQYKCVVYLKKGLRPPGVMVAERYWRVKEAGEIAEEEMEDGGSQAEEQLREWVRGVKVRGRRFFGCVLDWDIWSGCFGLAR